MLGKEELEKLAATLGFNLWQMERDYLQHLFLLFFSRRVSHELIFKGGTALQKTYGLNRFSIDLDFTQQQEFPKNIFLQIAQDMTRFGVATEIKEIAQKQSSLIKVICKGPWYQETERTLTVLRVEISLREKVLLPAETKEVFPLYPDLQPYIILVMQLEEILAEKIRAIFTRKKARDVFDLRFLLNKNVSLQEKLVQEKLRFYGLEYSQKELFKAISEIEPLWTSELSPLVVHVPDFKEVVREIKDKLKGK